MKRVNEEKSKVGGSAKSKGEMAVCCARFWRRCLGDLAGL